MRRIEKAVLSSAVALPLLLTFFGVPRLAALLVPDTYAADSVEVAGVQVSSPVGIDVPPPPTLAVPPRPTATPVIPPTPTPAPTATTAPTPAPVAQGATVYSGDGVFLRTAAGTGAPLALLKAGQPLAVLDQSIAAGALWLQVRTSDGKTGWILASLTGSSGAPSTPANTAAAPSPPASGSTYSVQSGDTLKNVAARYGVTVQALLNANTVPDADNLHVGQILTIPAAG